MKKSFLYIGFLGMGLLAGTSVMAQQTVAAKQRTATSRVVDSRSMKPVSNTATVRPVTNQEAKVAVANATTRQPQTQTPVAQPATNSAPVMQQKAQGKAGYSTK